MATKPPRRHALGQHHRRGRPHFSHLHQFHRRQRVQPLQQTVEALRVGGMHQHGDAEPRHLLGQHLAQLQAADVRGEDQPALAARDLLQHQVAVQVDTVGRVAPAQAEDLVQHRVGEGEEVAQAVAPGRRAAEHTAVCLQPLQVLHRGLSPHTVAQPMAGHHRPRAQAEWPAPEPAVHPAQEQHAGHRRRFADVGPVRGVLRGRHLSAAPAGGATAAAVRARACRRTGGYACG